MKPIIFAVLAAILYALSSPLSKLVGVFLSLLIFQQIPGVNFWIALVIMAWGTWLASV